MRELIPAAGGFSRLLAVSPLEGEAHEVGCPAASVGGGETSLRDQLEMVSLGLRGRALLRDEVGFKGIQRVERRL